MIIIFQYRVYRQDLKNNPDILYIFGDNLERKGFGGQAKEMRGEPNAFGIATKRKMAHGTKDCYFYDTDPNVEKIIESEFERLHLFLEGSRYNAIVIPSDGIGTGLAKLHENAPELLRMITSKLNYLENL